MGTVNGDLVGLAFTAGMVAALNPCGFAMLPAYLGLVVSGDSSQRDVVSRSNAVWPALRRALAATVAMALGFLTVFGAFGLLTVSVASALQRYLPYATVIVGILLVLAGLWLLSGRELGVPIAGRVARWAPTARVGSMYGYGVGYAVASLSCTVGPFLAVTGSSLRGGSVPGVLGVYGAYAAGLTLVVGVLAVAVAVASTTLIDRMRGVLPYVSRLSGVMLVAVGLYVVYYGWFEIRLYGSPGGLRDPVIAAAARIQTVLAGWVYANGPWPWVAGVMAIAAAAITATALTRCRRGGARRRSSELKSAI